MLAVPVHGLGPAVLASKRCDCLLPCPDARVRPEEPLIELFGEVFRDGQLQSDALGAASEQALFPTLGGSSTTLRITFQAPSEPGNYRSAWQAFNPAGEAFGDPFYIDFVVVNAPPAAETPAP